MKATPQSDDDIKGQLIKSLQQNKILQQKIVELQTQLHTEKQRQGDFVVIGNKPIPIRIVRWMDEWNMPWEVFWCYEHSEWVEELDSLFPYHMESSKCPTCK